MHRPRLTNSAAGLKLPLLGPVSLTGFQNAWFFSFRLFVLLVASTGRSTF